MFHSQNTLILHWSFCGELSHLTFQPLLKTPKWFFSNFNRNWFEAYNVLRVGLQDHLLNIAFLFAPDWFIYCNIWLSIFSSQSGYYVTSFPLLQIVITCKLNFFVSINHRFHEDIILVSSITLTFYIIPHQKRLLIHMTLKLGKFKKHAVNVLITFAKILQKIFTAKFKKVLKRKIQKSPHSFLQILNRQALVNQETST